MALAGYHRETASIAGLGATVQVDQASLDRVLARLNGDAKAAKKAVTRALNKIIVAVRTEVSRDVKTKVNIKLAMTRKLAMKIRKAFPRRQVAELTLSGKPMNLIAYGHKRTEHGIKYRILRKGKWTTIETAFFNPRTGQSLLRRAGSLHPPKGGVGARTWRGQVRSRYPVRGLTGPALTRVLIGLPEYARTVMDRRLGLQLQRELDMQVRVILESRDVPKWLSP